MNARVMVWWTARVLACGVIAAGCARTSSNVAEVYSVTGPDGRVEVRKNIVVNRPWLGERLEFGNIHTRMSGEFLEVQVAVTNTQSATRQIEYMFEWYDDDGFRVEAVGSKWTPQVVYGKQTVELRSVAPTPDATKVKLFVRPPVPVSE